MPSASVASVPAIAWRSGALSGGVGAAKMFLPESSSTLACTCSPLPAMLAYGFARNVASQPCARATLLTMRLKRSASSHTRSASGACARFTSYWPGPYSASEEVAGTFCKRHTRSISASNPEYSLRSVIELICVRNSRRPVSGPFGGCGWPAASRSTSTR
jgi:hypothetical protein